MKRTTRVHSSLYLLFLLISIHNGVYLCLCETFDIFIFLVYVMFAVHMIWFLILFNFISLSRSMNVYIFFRALKMKRQIKCQYVKDRGTFFFIIYVSFVWIRESMKSQLKKALLWVAQNVSAMCEYDQCGGTSVRWKWHQNAVSIQFILILNINNFFLLWGRGCGLASTCLSRTVHYSSVCLNNNGFKEREREHTFRWRPLNTTANAPCPIKSRVLYS